MSKQQSLARALKRGNAIFEFSFVTNSIRTVFKKNTYHKNGWRNRVKKYALVADMDSYQQMVHKNN